MSIRTKKATLVFSVFMAGMVFQMNIVDAIPPTESFEPEIYKSIIAVFFGTFFGLGLMSISGDK